MADYLQHKLGTCLFNILKEPMFSLVLRTTRTKPQLSTLTNPWIMYDANEIVANERKIHMLDNCTGMNPSSKAMYIFLQGGATDELPQAGKSDIRRKKEAQWMLEKQASSRQRGYATENAESYHVGNSSMAQLPDKTHMRKGQLQKTFDSPHRKLRLRKH